MPPKAAAPAEAEPAPVLLSLLQSMGLTDTAAALVTELQKRREQQEGKEATAGSHHQGTAASPSAGGAAPRTGEAGAVDNNPSPASALRNAADTQQQLTERLLEAAKAPLACTRGTTWDDSVRVMAAASVEPIARGVATQAAELHSPEDVMHAMTSLFHSLHALSKGFARSNSNNSSTAAPPSPAAEGLLALLVQYYRILWLQQLLVESVVESDLLPPLASIPSPPPPHPSALPEPVRKGDSSRSNVAGGGAPVIMHAMPVVASADAKQYRGRRLPSRVVSVPAPSVTHRSPPVAKGAMTTPKPQEKEGVRARATPITDDPRGHHILQLASQLQGAVQSLRMLVSALHQEHRAGTQDGTEKEEGEEASLLCHVVGSLASGGGDRHVAQWSRNAARMVQWVLYRYTRTAVGPSGADVGAGDARRKAPQVQQSVPWTGVLADLHDAVTKAMDISAALGSPDDSTEGVPSVTQKGPNPAGEAATRGPQEHKIADVRILFTLSRTRLALWGLQSLHECVSAMTTGSSRQQRFALESATSVMEGQWACTAASLLLPVTHSALKRGDAAADEGSHREEHRSASEKTKRDRDVDVTVRKYEYESPLRQQRGRRQPPPPPLPLQRAQHPDAPSSSASQPAGGTTAHPVAVAQNTAAEEKVCAIADSFRRFAQQLLLLTPPASTRSTAPSLSGKASTCAAHRRGACACFLRALSLRLSAKPARPPYTSSPQQQQQQPPQLPSDAGDVGAIRAATGDSASRGQDGRGSGVPLSSAWDAAVYYSYYTFPGSSTSTAAAGDGCSAGRGDIDSPGAPLDVASRMTPAPLVQTLPQSVAGRGTLESLMRALTVGQLTLKSPRRRRIPPLRHLLRRALDHQQTLLDLPSLRMPAMLQLRAIQHTSVVADLEEARMPSRPAGQHQPQQRGPRARDAAGGDAGAAALAGASAHVSVETSEGDTHVSGSVHFSDGGGPCTSPSSMLGVGQVPASLRLRASSARGGHGRSSSSPEGSAIPTDGPPSSEATGARGRPGAAAATHMRHMAHILGAVVERVMYPAERASRPSQRHRGDAETAAGTSRSSSDRVNDDDSTSGSFQRSRDEEEVEEEEQDSDDQLSQASSTDMHFNHRRDEILEEVQQVAVTPCGTLMAFLTTRGRLVVYALQDPQYGDGYREELLVDTALPGGPYRIHWYDLCSVILQFSPDGRFLLAAAQFMPTAVPEGAEDERMIPESTGRICIFSLHRDSAASKAACAPSSTLSSYPFAKSRLFRLPGRLYGEVAAHAAPVMAARWAEPQFWGGGWTSPEEVVVMSEEKLNSSPNLAQRLSVGRASSPSARWSEAATAEAERVWAWHGAAKARLAALQCFSTGMDNVIVRWLPSSGVVLQKLRTTPLEDFVISPLMSAIYTIDTDGELAMYDVWNEKDAMTVPRADGRQSVAVRERGLPASLALMRTPEETASRAERLQAEPLADPDLPSAFFSGTRVIAFDRREVQGGPAERRRRPVTDKAGGGSGEGSGSATATATATTTTTATPRGTASQQAADLGRHLIMQVLNDRVTAPLLSHVALSSSSSASLCASLSDLSDETEEEEPEEEDEEEEGDYPARADSSRPQRSVERGRARSARSCLSRGTAGLPCTAAPGERISRVHYRSGTRLHFIEVGRALCHATGLEPIRIDRTMGTGGSPYQLLSMAPSAQPAWARIRPAEEEAQYRSLLRLWHQHSHGTLLDGQMSRGGGWTSASAVNGKNVPLEEQEERRQSRKRLERRQFALLSSVSFYTDAPDRCRRHRGRESHGCSSEADRQQRCEETAQQDSLDLEREEWRSRALRRAQRLRGCTTPLKPTASNGRYLSILAAVGPYRMLLGRGRPLEFKPGVYASLIFDTYTSTVLRVIPICPVQPNPLLAERGTLPTHLHAKKTPVFALQSSLSVVVRPRARAWAARSSSLPPHGEEAVAGASEEGDAIDEYRREEDAWDARMARRVEDYTSRPRPAGQRAVPASSSMHKVAQEEMLVLSVGGLHDSVYIYDALTGDRMRTLVLGKSVVDDGKAPAPLSTAEAGGQNNRAAAAAGAAAAKALPRRAGRSFEDVLSSVTSWDAPGLTTSSTTSHERPTHGDRADFVSSPFSSGGGGIGALLDTHVDISDTSTDEVEEEEVGGNGLAGRGGKTKERGCKSRRHDATAATGPANASSRRRGVASSAKSPLHAGEGWQEHPRAVAAAPAQAGVSPSQHRAHVRRQQLYDALVRRFGPVMVLQAQRELLRVLPTFDDEDIVGSPAPEVVPAAAARAAVVDRGTGGESEEGSSGDGGDAAAVGPALHAQPPQWPPFQAPCTGFLGILRKLGSGGAAATPRMPSRSAPPPPPTAIGIGKAKPPVGHGRRVSLPHRPFALAAQQLEEVRRALKARLSAHNPSRGPSAAASAPSLQTFENAFAAAAEAGGNGHNSLTQPLSTQQRPARLYCGVVNCVSAWGDANGGFYLVAGTESGRMYLAGGPLCDSHDEDEATALP